MAQMVKNLPAMQEIGVRSMGWEDPLQKGMATHSIILAWRIPWTEEFSRLQSMGLQSVGHNRATELAHTWLKQINNMNLLYTTGSSTQCSMVT